MTKKITTFLFWGSIWGIAEATIGWLLHVLHVHAVGFWMYPISLACMLAAYRASGRTSWICYVAIVAGLIKLTDLLIPIPAFHIVNASIHIMLEGVAVALFVKMAASWRLNLPVAYLSALGCLLASGYAWRLWQLAASALWVHNPGAQMFWTAERMLPWIGQCLILSALVVIGYKLVCRYPRQKDEAYHYPINWTVSTLMLAVAVTIFIG